MLRMTDEGDIQITNNRFTLVDQDAEVRQRLLQNLRTFFGEWFLDVTIGVPYFQIIFVKGASPQVVEASIKDVILATEGVRSLESFSPLDLNSATRELRVKFSVKTVTGTEFNLDEVLV